MYVSLDCRGVIPMFQSLECDQIGAYAVLHSPVVLILAGD